MEVTVFLGQNSPMTGGGGVILSLGGNERDSVPPRDGMTWESSVGEFCGSMTPVPNI